MSIYFLFNLFSFVMTDINQPETEDNKTEEEQSKRMSFIK
jgi:hypothetical protein